MLERSIADVSFLFGMLVDKFVYHLPLYRQHQGLSQCGITLSRTTLTTLAGQAIDLLKPAPHVNRRSHVNGGRPALPTASTLPRSTSGGHYV